jgi:glyoxylase-like metal-dependent hydrolase (beta-lactamase superfamily II)
MELLTFRTGPISVNTYIVYDEKTLQGFIIDPGGNYKRIKAEAAARGIELRAQLLTHGHFDHCGASKALQNDGVRVYIHQSDADKTESGGSLARFFGADFENFSADELLSGGETLQIAGFSVRVLHTPGHSSGSVCYLAENKLFSGDTLFHMSVGRTDFPDGDAKALSRSIREKLFKLAGDYELYPGHDEFSTLEYERLYNPYTEYGK